MILKCYSHLLISLHLSWYNNDVALIKLSRPAKLNKYVNLVCLPERGDDQQVGVIVRFLLLSLHCYRYHLYRSIVVTGKLVSHHFY